MKRPFIVCAALKLGDVLIVGPRHFDPIMRSQLATYGLLTQGSISAEQGFIDQWGAFHSREAAMRFAKENGQLNTRERGSSKELFSEDLY